MYYYPLNRIVGAIRPEIPDRYSIHNLNVYENALGDKTNYQSFFEWFRIQDDILNEKAQSRSKWMMQNRRWIKEKVNRLLNLFKETIPYDENYSALKESNYLIERFEKDKIIYEEPRFLFHELSELTRIIRMRSREHLEYENIIHDLDYMFHKMSSLISEYRDDLIEEGGLHEQMVKRIIQSFERVWHEEKSDKSIIAFLWESFSFAILLSLWWLSDKGKRDLEQELQIIWRPIELRESKSLNWTTKQLLSSLKQIIKREILQKKNICRKEGQELRTVTKAIEQFVPEYSHLRVKRVPRPHMLIDKNGESFNLDQLSDGEKNLIALVGDIARRLSIANQMKNKLLEGEGVVLIDEIDLHLHPKWQRFVVPKLLELFPNCQFFISTHSPQVIGHVKPENVFLLEQSDDGLNYRRVDETYGMSLDRVVELVMDDESRPDPVRDDLDKLFELIERKKFDEAKKLVFSLKKYMKTDPELMRAETLIRREELKK